MTIVHPRRISVVGTTGAGKTTLARQIARWLEIPHVELDALYWGPDWTPAPVQVFRVRVADAVKEDAWVVDGNYSRVRNMVWERAQMAIWLDYTLPVILWQLIRRTLRRSIGQDQLWNENRESLYRALFSRESIVLWALKTYRRRRKEYSALFEETAYAHLNVVHLPSPRSARAWMAALQTTGMSQSSCLVDRELGGNHSV